MRKTIFALLIGFLGLSLYSQDSISKSKAPFLLRPYFENGIDFIRNDELKQNYETQSKYYWGLGVQFGHPDIFKIFPYAQYSYSNFEMVQNISQDIKFNTSLTTSQISGGLMIYLKKTDNFYLRNRVGYSFAQIQESYNDIDAKSHGFQIGLGIERKVFKNSRIYFDLTYNYQKTDKSEFRDFDMIKMSIGFIL